MRRGRRLLLLLLLLMMKLLLLVLLLLRLSLLLLVKMQQLHMPLMRLRLLVVQVELVLLVEVMVVGGGQRLRNVEIAAVGRGSRRNGRHDGGGVVVDGHGRRRAGGGDGGHGGVRVGGALRQVLVLEVAVVGGGLDGRGRLDIWRFGGRTRRRIRRGQRFASVRVSVLVVHLQRGVVMKVDVTGATSQRHHGRRRATTRRRRGISSPRVARDAGAAAAGTGLDPLARWRTCRLPLEGPRSSPLLLLLLLPPPVIIWPAETHRTRKPKTRNAAGGRAAKRRRKRHALGGWTKLA